jgi:membrane protein involved in colicin uptake
MHHYTYRMDRTDKPTGEYYIGVRQCKCLPEEDVNYRGSGVRLKRMQKSGAQFRKTILATFSTREESCADEARRVTAEVLLDPLCINERAGGMNGAFSEETLRKIRAANHRRSRDQEWQRNNREANQRKAKNPEWQRKHMEGCQRSAEDPEWQRKQREGSQRRSENPEWQRKMREAGQKRSKDPEWQRKQREGAKRAAEDPEWKRKNLEANQRKAENPEWQRKQREGAQRRSKLDADKVREIRRRAAAGETQIALAREFGISQTSISRVVLRKTWKNVD